MLRRHETEECVFQFNDHHEKSFIKKYKNRIFFIDIILHLVVTGRLSKKKNMILKRRKKSVQNLPTGVPIISSSCCCFASFLSTTTPQIIGAKKERREKN